MRGDWTAAETAAPSATTRRVCRQIQTDASEIDRCPSVGIPVIAGASDTGVGPFVSNLGCTVSSIDINPSVDGKVGPVSGVNVGSSVGVSPSLATLRACLSGLSSGLLLVPWPELRPALTSGPRRCIGWDVIKANAWGVEAPGVGRAVLCHRQGKIGQGTILALSPVFPWRSSIK